FLNNVWRTRRRGAPAGNDPWGGATLEWSMSCPPPVYNFSVIPTVESRLPRWRTEYHAAMQDPPDRPPAPVHVPGGSWWPLITALGLPLMATGAIAHQLWLVFVGVAVLVLGLYRWAYEPFEL
ncbi:MAG: aa3-type cytochrome oxidase subunit IV, partial [Dehalococcoidia bacterium]